MRIGAVLVVLGEVSQWMFAISTDGLERWGVLGLLMGGLRNNLLLLQNFDLDDLRTAQFSKKSRSLVKIRQLGPQVRLPSERSYSLYYQSIQ